MARIVAAVMIAAIAAGCSGEPAADRPPRSVAATSSPTQPHETWAVVLDPAPPTSLPQATSTSTTAAPTPTVTDDPAPRTINVPDAADIDDLLGSLYLIIGDLDANLGQNEGGIFDD